jgi:general stress protein 26
MEAREIMDRVRAILDAHGVGVLATVGEDGKPHLRWLTPVVFAGRQGVIYALTILGFPKVRQLKANPCVEWMFQTSTLEEVVTARGTMNVVDNPSLRSETLEAIGPRMRSLWRLSREAKDLVVLETVLEEATHYLPIQGIKRVVSFK